MSLSVHPKSAFLLNSQAFSFINWNAWFYSNCYCLHSQISDNSLPVQELCLVAHKGLGYMAKAAVWQYYNVCQVAIQSVADNSLIISMFLWNHAIIFLLLHKALNKKKITIIFFFPCHTNNVISWLCQKKISICKHQIKLEKGLLQPPWYW